MAELITALTQLGWLVLACTVIYLVLPELRSRIAKLSRLTIDSSGKLIFDIEKEVDELLAKKELAAQEEAREEGESIPAQEIHPADNNIILWATGGLRHPAGEIAVLADAGFRVEEIQPGNLFKSNLFDSDNVAAVVTNLKHGKNYSGGLEFVHKIRARKPDYPVILYTSKTAQERRSAHIDKIGADEIATDTLELLLAAHKLSKRTDGINN